MRHIVIVEPSLPSFWGSCQTIIPNLVSTYRHFAGARLRQVDYGRESTSLEILEAARQIRLLDPSHLVFVDHQKHPKQLFDALDFVYGKKKWPRIVVHIYGDFTLFTDQWFQCEDQLRNRFLHFVCASPRQRKMVARFIKGGAKRTSVCHFPVLKSEFKFTEGLREKARRNRNVEADEFLMTYTGRLSLQKNILKMISESSRAAESLGLKWRLLLAGSFDDIGSPFFGLHLATHAYYHGIQKLLQELEPHVRQKIEFLGPLDKRELKALYHASDLFISLSTHHDEDYGMSPVEALACGTPALLSDWGGFGGFAVDRRSVDLIPVTLGGAGPKMKTTGFTHRLKRIHRSTFVQTADARASRSEDYLGAFGIERAAEKLEAVIANSDSTTFDGFSPLLRRHSKLIRNWSRVGRVFKLGRELDPNYKLIYKSYLNEKGQ